MDAVQNVKDARAHKENKLVMMYHRSYRKLPGSLRGFFVQFFFLALPLSLVTAVFYPELTRFVCLCATTILEPHFAADTLSIFTRPYFESIGPLSYIDIPGRFPSFLFSLFNALAAILLLLFIPSIQRYKPLMIFLVIISVVHFLSSAYFLLFPAHFPYEATDYSQLYMLQEISIWFFVPIIMGLAIIPLPASWLSKGGIMAATYIYALLFGILRYAVFLYILSHISMIYMAVLFFALGPLVDFIYIVGIYSLFLNRLSKKLSEDFSIWKWQ